jgi:hypothetical protein
MQQQTEIFTKVYVFRKPHMSGTILYRTFDAASRACTMEYGEIEEWIRTACVYRGLGRG